MVNVKNGKSRALTENEVYEIFETNCN
jgi:hypothetical protein